jgi:hypothetical protein
LVQSARLVQSTWLLQAVLRSVAVSAQADSLQRVWEGTGEVRSPTERGSEKVSSDTQSGLGRGPSGSGGLHQSSNAL